MQLLEIKRLKLELVKVAAARAELEFRVEERMDEINRIKDHIKIQIDKEEELTGRIEEAETTPQS
jgi:C4-dicarboxylate-specific signal transduction histidine kinase